MYEKNFESANYFVDYFTLSKAAQILEVGKGVLVNKGFNYFNYDSKKGFSGS